MESHRFEGKKVYPCNQLLHLMSLAEIQTQQVSPWYTVYFKIQIYYYSLFKQIFIEHLLYAKYYPKLFLGRCYWRK